MTLFFPDNSVLVSFAHIGRLDVLEELLQGRGHWVGAVAAECENSANYPGLSDLARVPAFMAPTLIAERAELVDARVIQAQLRAPGDPPAKSYGEAETIAVVVRRQLQTVFLTDDGDAISYISEHEPSIRTVRTNELLALAVRAGLISRDDALAGLATLRRLRRTHMSDESFRGMLPR